MEFAAHSLGRGRRPHVGACGREGRDAGSERVSGGGQTGRLDVPRRGGCSARLASNPPCRPPRHARPACDRGPSTGRARSDEARALSHGREQALPRGDPPWCRDRDARCARSGSGQSYRSAARGGRDPEGALHLRGRDPPDPADVQCRQASRCAAPPSRAEGSRGRARAAPGSGGAHRVPCLPVLPTSTSKSTARRAPTSAPSPPTSGRSWAVVPTWLRSVASGAALSP